MKLVLFVLTSIYLLPNAYACSCAGWTNAYHAALQKNSIVAKVSTVNVFNSVATVNVQKVYKGAISKSQIKILGQDGANCNGQILNNNTNWIVIFSKNEKGGYETLSCADTALTVNTSNKKIQLRLGEDFSITDSQFQELVALKQTPSIKGIQCDFFASRMETGYNDPTLALEFYESASATKETPNELIVDYNLSGRGAHLKNLNFYISTQKRDQRTFDVWARFNEPFHTGSYNTNHSVDITQTYSIAQIGFNDNIDQNGDGRIDNDEPYISMAASASCRFKAGLPLVRLAQPALTLVDL